MSSEDGDAGKAVTVAKVATKLFGTKISADAVIDESLERATDPKLNNSNITDQLAATVNADIPTTITQMWIGEQCICCNSWECRC